MFKYKLFVNVFILLHVYVQLSPVLKLWVEGLIPYYKSRKFNMKEENYNYRTSQTLLHNQFPGKGKCQIPIIPKFPARADAFNDVLLIGFNKIHLEDQAWQTLSQLWGITGTVRCWQRLAAAVQRKNGRNRLRRRNTAEPKLP